MGAKFIEVRRISYTSDQVFWVDFFKDTPYIIEQTIKDETESLIRPSMTLVSNLEWELGENLHAVAELSYKFTFVGAKYGHTPLNTQNTTSIAIALKYRL